MSYEGNPGAAQTRIGDAEREAAARVLGEHFAAGRLDEAEHSTRVDTAYAAKTEAQLDELFVDLPYVATVDEGSDRPKGRSPGRTRPVGPPWGRVMAFPLPVVVIGGLLALSIVVHAPFILVPVLLFFLLSRAAFGWGPRGRAGWAAGRGWGGPPPWAGRGWGGPGAWGGPSGWTAPERSKWRG